MESTPGFTDSVEEGLRLRKAQLDSKDLPQLREQYKLFHSAFQGLYNVFLKKGIVQEDPYKYDTKLSEVTTPSEASFTEAEKADQMNSRLSAYEAQLDFLVNYYQFSTDFLDMGRVKRLLALTKYIAWNQCSPNSTNINTRVLAEFVSAVKATNDQLSTGLANDALMRLEQGLKAILGLLKELAGYHRETWKVELRRKLTDGLALEREWVVTHKDEAVRQIKRKFAIEWGEAPFYADLVEEILDEDYAQDAAAKRQALLKGLEAREEKKATAKEEQNFKALLLDGVKILSSVSYQVSDASLKLQENHQLLRQGGKGFGEAFRRFVRKVFNVEEKEVVYEAEFPDPLTGQMKTEKIPFAGFVEELDKKSKLFQSLGARGSPASARLLSSTEEHVFSFLQKNLEELQSIHRRLGAMDTYFKSEVPREERERLRGIKVELATIKNSLIKANQKKHEYVSRKEELEQMRKLGVRTEAN